jgi:diguanylate cyclase (GGDEF)-like protein
VDTDEPAAEELDGLLELYNYEVIKAFSAEDAIHRAGKMPFDSLVVSLDMEDGGFDLGQKLRETEGHGDAPIAYVTGTEYDFALLMEAQFYGALFLIKKPFVDCEVLAQLSTMIRLKFLQDELKERMVELDRLASTDPLTGLYNRRMFFRRMEEELARAGRASDPMCLMYLDIDHFKQINDTYGHSAGDAVLKQIARLMQRTLRRGDVLGRIGGEEFLVYLPDTTGHSGQRIAERLRERVERATILYEDTQIKVTISIGVFFVEDPIGLGLDELVKASDELLYEAKSTGRNKVVYRGLGEGAD